MIANGYIYHIGNGNRDNIWKLPTSKGAETWNPVAPPAVTYITHDDTYIYGVGTDQALWRTKALEKQTGGWDKIASCCVSQITYHDKHIFGVGRDYKVYVVKASGGKLGTIR